MLKLYKLKDLPFRKGYFWSYDYNTASLPLSRILEQLIKYGGFDDHINMFKVFPFDELKDTYLLKVRPIMSGEVIPRPGMIPTKTDLKNVKYMDFLFEALKDVAA